ncbi:MAG TPA: helix-turn-helix domain-containing protein [Puia sp.]|jgi:AraC-like DNA-binding protein|nr:helix-turn-helix domain-containing protein [Puia sp.]
MTYYHQYQPGTRLSAFVECYWVSRSSGSEGREERLIPGGRVEMIFHLGTSFHWLIHPESPQGELVTGVQFMGQRDRVYFGRCPGHTEMLGVRWKPGGLAALTATPLSGFLNKMVPAEAVLGSRIKGWEDRLQDQQGDLNRVGLLEQLLTGLIGNGQIGPGSPGGPGVLQAAVGMIRERPDELSVQAICQQTGWYYKKLERAFQESVGYSPKQYCRIIRFNRAIRLIHQHQSLSLTKISHGCGYYDQSHFIKDFYRYAGVAPGSWKPGEHSIADFLIRYQPV